jgi:hypothetical protein
VQNINPNERQILFIGIDAMLWTIWLSQNDIVFNKTSTLSYMQFIYRYPLGKDGGAIPKEERSTPSSKYMPSIRNSDNRDFH